MTTGGCQCGHVRYAFEGAPMNAVFCYCTDCQQRTGSDKWHGLWVANDKLQFLEGHTPATHTRLGSSGQPVHHHFCPHCGVTVAGGFTAGGFYSVAATSVDGGWGEMPKAAIYAASAPGWAVLPGDIPVYDALPPM